MEKKKTKKWVKVMLIAGAVVIVLAVAVFAVLKMTFLRKFAELNGEPTIGQWYDITPEGAMASDGSEWHGIFRKGSENKVIVYFFGGGVSIDEYTSARPELFYTARTENQDFIATWGIGSQKDENPFKDWTMIVLPYSTGDFHCGTGSVECTDDNGNTKTVYHNGYNNYSLLMDMVLPHVGEPDTLLITGFSAGGFGTSLLADDVIDRFPTAKNITVCVDSSLILYDGWHDTAVNLWKSPSEISDRLTTNNIVLDSLTALHEKRGDSIKILFDCSIRDDTLLAYQNYIDSGFKPDHITAEVANTVENGDKFQAALKVMVESLQSNINGVGVYIWDYNRNEKTGNTQHTILSSAFLEKLEDGKSIADWLYDAVNGDVQSYGLNLLNDK